MDYTPKLREILPAATLFSDVRFSDDLTIAAEHVGDDSHIHSCCEIYLNLSGDVSFLVESNVYPVEPGDVIITKPNEFHHCIYHSDSVHAHYCLWLAADHPLLPLLSFFYDRKNGEMNRISMRPADKQQLAAAFEMLWQAKCSGSLGKARGLSAVFSVLDILQTHRFDTGEAQKLPRDLLAIVSFLDTHYSGDCSMAELERRFFTSRSTLNRRFRTHLNTSPAKYVETRRLAAAKMMLEQGASVQETCAACGFSDYSHFIALFKRKFGTTPFQYAKTYR